MSRSLGDALENQADRYLPGDRSGLGIDSNECFLRTPIGSEKINLFAHAQRRDEIVTVVGESLAGLDDRSTFEHLERPVQLAAAPTGLPVVPLLFNHYARPQGLELADRQGVLVILSFEWATA